MRSGCIGGGEAGSCADLDERNPRAMMEHYGDFEGDIAPTSWIQWDI